jgi:hypothetical protein
MSALTAARQDILLRRYEFTRRGVVRVQANADTAGLLNLAGFEMPAVFDWYDVPVRENADGQLEVDVPRNGEGPAALSPGESPAFGRQGGAPAPVKQSGARILQPHERVFWGLPEEVEKIVNKLVPYATAQGVDLGLPDLHRYRVEVRIDDTWLNTVIVDAANKEAAGFAALERFVSKDPSLSYDVWSVALEENPAAIVEETAGVSPGSEPVRAPGEDAPTASDPGLARHSSPAFASADVSQRGESSPRGENEVLRCPVCNAEAVAIAIFADGSPHPAYACGCPRKDLDPAAPPLDQPPRRRFRVPLAEDHCVIVEVSTFYNRALPSPHEPEEWVAHAPPSVDLSAAFAALHRARQFEDFEVQPA